MKLTFDNWLIYTCPKLIPAVLNRYIYREREQPDQVQARVIKLLLPFIKHCCKVQRYSRQDIPHSTLTLFLFLSLSLHVFLSVYMFVHKWVLLTPNIWLDVNQTASYIILPSISSVLCSFLVIYFCCLFGVEPDMQALCVPAAWLKKVIVYCI